MTHHTIRTEPDGTRVYSNYTRYTPVPDHLRKKNRRKPDDPRAVRWKGDWFLPLEVLSDDERTMPQTQPDADAGRHLLTNLRCQCQACTRPLEITKRWRQRALYGPEIPATA